MNRDRKAIKIKTESGYHMISNNVVYSGRKICALGTYRSRIYHAGRRAARFVVLGSADET